MSVFTSSGGKSSSGGSTQITVTGTVKSMFSESLAVASSATSDLLTYTVPGGISSYLFRAEMSGTNIATYDVLLNGNQLARIRTYFGGPFTGTVEFGKDILGAFPIVAGDVVIIRVTNFRPTSGDFEARLQYSEV